MSSPESLTDTRRADILRAALKCFAAKGFHATTMSDIARACEMSAGNLYNYFAGKVDIVEELARHCIGFGIHLPFSSFAHLSFVRGHFAAW